MSSKMASASFSERPECFITYSSVQVTRWSLKTPLMSWCRRSGARRACIFALGNECVNGWSWWLSICLIDWIKCVPQHRCGFHSWTTALVSRSLKEGNLLSHVIVCAILACPVPLALHHIYKTILVRNLGNRTIPKSRNILCTPSWDDTCQKYLFRVVGNVWANTKNSASKKTIWAVYDLCLLHVVLQWRENKLQACMIELTLKPLEVGVVTLGLAN